jgi:hypothetical protein
MDLYTLQAQIGDTLDQLETATEDYAILSKDAALAESRYKLCKAQAIVHLATDGFKRSVAEREAYAELRCRDELELYLVTRAASDATKQAHFSIRARLDALRTLSADVRTVTDPRNPS